MSGRAKDQSSNRQSLAPIIVPIVTAVLGLIGTVTVAYFQFYVPNKLSIEATQTAEARLVQVNLSPTVTSTSTPTFMPEPASNPSPTMPGPIPANTPTPEPTDIPTNVATPTPSDTPTNTPTPMPAATPTHTPTPTPETRKPKPPPTPDFSGKLAIPVMLGFQSKVYVTEFNGAGINGPRPVSLDARQPMFSQDGKSLIVKGTTGGLSGVFVTDDRGRVLEILIDRDSAYWPVLSPDGSEVMFAEMTLDYKLLRRKSNGVISEVQANNRPILAYNALWSDDNRLVFQGCATWLEQPGECGTWVTDANNIAPVRIIVGNHGRPMDAKSGLLAYMSDEDGDWDIYLVSLGGGEPQNITLNRSQDGLAAIAPDGKSVAYISNESGIWALWTVTLSNREKQRWFDIDPQRGTIDVNNWAGERLSWTR